MCENRLSDVDVLSVKSKRPQAIDLTHLLTSLMLQTGQYSMPVIKTKLDLH